MMDRVVRGVVFAAMLAGTLSVGWAQSKRPMTFADLQRMKRVSDPQISASGKWVMFSVVDVDLEKNSKVSHLWVVPLDGASGSGSGAGQERQVTFWKEGESGGRFSPDGKQVLFVATDSTTGLSQIFLAPWDDATGTLGTPQRLTKLGTEADGAVWSPDSSKILFVSRVYPECSDEAVWVDEDTCDKTKDDAAAASPVKAQIWDHLLYRHWDHYVGPKRSHVLMVSATDGGAVRDLTPRRSVGDAEAPTFSTGGPVGYAWAPDSKEIAFVTNLDLVPAASTNNDVFTVRIDDPAAQPERISTSLGSDDAPAYSPDGRWLAFRSQARAGYESDRFRLMLFDRQAKATKELMPKFDGWVDEFVWVDDSHHVLFVAGDRGESPIYETNITGDDLKRFGKTKGEWSDISEVKSIVSMSGIAIVGSLMRVDHPTEIVLADPLKMNDSGREFTITLAAGAPQRETTKAAYEPIVLTHLNDALFESIDIPAMESYWFTGAEGAKVQGFIIRPPNFDPTHKYPLKFLIHGGPQGAWGDAWSYRWNPELMAASGYVVVMVNPHGSTGYGQAFIDGVNGDWGGKPYVDLMKGLDYAEQHYPFIDKTRECALGASYGGFMANWILTHTDRFACIVTHDGMFNPQSAYGDTEELWFNEWEFRQPGTSEPGQPWRYFDKPAAADPFRRWSPMLAIRNAKTPTLVIHSQRDYRLDVSEGMQLFTALQRLNVPSRMLYFPDEGHWVLKPQNSKLWNETVGDWCDRWTKTNLYAVKGAEIAAPVVEVAPAAQGKTRETAKASVRSQPGGEASVPSASSPSPAPSRPASPQPVDSTRTGISSPVEGDAPVSVAEAPAVGAAANQAQSGAGAFSIAISVADNEVQIGSDARVTITLKNLSDHQMLFGHHPGRDNPEFSFRIEVRNALGRAVEETAYASAITPGERSENRTVDYVQPGGTTVQVAHLAKLVRLTKAGRYTVQVSRRDAQSGVWVMSNVLTLNVVP